jgi:hypothetical protein
VNNPQTEVDVAPYEILSMLDNSEVEVGEDDQANDVTATRPTRILCEPSSASSISIRRRSLSLDPLLELNSDEVITLMRQYDDMIGARYPFLEMEVLIQQTKELYLLVEASSRTEDDK